VLGFEPMTYGSESECATHYTTATHNECSLLVIVIVWSSFSSFSLAVIEAERPPTRQSVSIVVFRVVSSNTMQVIRLCDACVAVAL